MRSAQSRSLSARYKTIPLWSAALFLSLTACGYQGSQERSTVKDESSASSSSTISFANWCDTWAVNCETPAASSEVPISLDAVSWEALTAIGKEALSNPLTFDVTRAEIDSPELSRAFATLGLTAELNQVKATLDDSQWQSLRIEDKSLVSRSVESGSVSVKNGLTLQAGPVLSLSLGADSALNIDGLGLSSQAGGQSSELKTLTPGEENSINLGLTAETVQNVPFAFLEDSLSSALGFEDAVSDPLDISKEQIFAAAYPLLSWANKPQRTVSLNRQFFALAQSELSPILSGEDFGPAVLDLMSALNSFAISASSGRNVVQLSQVNGAKLECNMNNGEAKVMFDKDFGLKRFYQVDGGGIGLEFFGVRATARLALGIPLTLKRIELKGNKVTILDIPLIGKIDVDLDQLTGGEDEEKVFACDK